MVSDDVIKAQLSKTLDKSSFNDLGAKYEGKVRDCYTRDGHRTIVVTDRLSAFDVVLGTIPFKGQVLNQLAAYWFEATAHLVPNHVLSVPDPQVMVATECKLLPVEFVMRSYLTGVTSTSIWRHYEQGARVFCGHKLPEGMRKNQRLEKAILTTSTKAEKGGHDESVSREQILAMGALTAEDFDAAGSDVRKAICLRARGRRQARADPGRHQIRDPPPPRRDPVFIDEIHTPDSSRYWYADDYQARFDRGDEPRGLDKEYVRRTLADQGYRGEGPAPTLTAEVRTEAARRYIALFELVTGRAFVPDSEEPLARIRRNLKV